jgi:DNA-binding GntR family transcriptional regulator
MIGSKVPPDAADPLARLIPGANVPMRSRTAHEYVLRVLRDSVIEGTLAGGTWLRQADIAAQLQVSVTPVREALRDLASEGLVIFDPHRGALVRSLDLVEVQELYEIRMTLEPLMVKRCITLITPDQIGRADRLQREMEDTGEIAIWVELNRQFHEVLAEPGSGSRLASILALLRDSASSYVAFSLRANLDRLAESNVEHAQLVDLYRRGDLEAALRVTRQHLLTTLATIEDASGSSTANSTVVSG